ncbi:MAG: hypothetical protein HUU35_06675, partial [Armatimonadetes bacterium]|nr:hypothetical protein [Armatimonadota bacterium]
MCESGVFGRIHPADPARFAADEELLSGNFDAEQRMQAATRDYGMWNYGDGHTIWDLGRGRWHDVYRTWRNTHHGAPRVPWLLYVRSGDPKYLAAAIRNTRHVLDIDFCHFSTPETEKLEYPNGKLKGALNDYKGIVHWHSGNRLTDYNSMTDFALWYWQLTGDRWGLEVAQEWGEAVKAKYTGPFGHREGAGTCSALIDLYLETGDPEYRRMVEEFIERFITREQSDGTRPYPTEMVQKYPGLADQPAPVGSFPQWENYAPWLERYIDLTDDPRAKQALVRWADAYLAGYGDSCSYWSIGDYTNILGYAYLLTGDEKYLKRGRWELDRAQQSVYRGENPLPQGLIQLGQTSLAGYIVQRAPILMAALAKHGKPVAPEALYRPSSGFRLPIRRTRPVIDGQPKKVEEVEAWLLEATDAPLTITCQVSHNYEQWKVTARLLGPDGQPVAELTASWPKGSKSIELSAPADGKTGIYRLTVTGEGSYWGVAQPIRTAPALPTAFPLKERIVTLSGAEYHVYLPASAREATARLTAQAGTELAAQWKGPEGTWQPCSTTSDGQPFTTPALAVPAAGRGQVWSLILNGGSAAMEVLVDGQPQPLVFQAAYPAAICEALLAAK